MAISPLMAVIVLALIPAGIMVVLVAIPASMRADGRGGLSADGAGAFIRTGMLTLGD